MEDTVNNQKIDMNNQGLCDTLEALQLQMITIGDWILIQRATFDINVKEEPYHSIQIYANVKTMTYIRRVWGISERRGELHAMEDITDLCIATFKKSVVCSGHISPGVGRDHLFQVSYPFNRWVSGSCLIRYTQDQGGEIIGVCSECSGVGANIKKDGDGMIGEICTDTEHNEVCEEQEIKCEKEERENYFNESPRGSKGEYDDNWLGSDETMDHPYEDPLVVEYSENKQSYMENTAHDIEGENQESNADNGSGTKKRKKDIKRRTDLTKQQRQLARSILIQYNSLLTVQHGGVRLSKEDNLAALNTFITTTGCQIDLVRWRKLCSRLRIEEAEQCSGGSENIKTEHNEAVKEQETKCEKVEQEGLMNSTDLNSQNSSEEEWLGSGETMKQHYEDDSEGQDDNLFHNEEYWSKMRGESQVPQSRAPNFSQEELEFARCFAGCWLARHLQGP